MKVSAVTFPEVQRNQFLVKFTASVLIVLIVTSQIYVGHKIRQRLMLSDKNGAAEGRGDDHSDSSHRLFQDSQDVEAFEKAEELEVAADEFSREPGNLVHLLRNMPRPEVDEADFLSDVVEPQKEMLEKFPEHPELVIKKLLKMLHREESRSFSLKNEISRLRTALGLKPSQKDDTDVVIGRKLSSLPEKNSYYHAPDLPKCPDEPPGLFGTLFVQQQSVPELLPGSPEFREWYGDVREGGKFRPEQCQARQKVAIIIPYRDRYSHLRLWLYHMHPILQRQLLDYQVFVIEQSVGQEFNRAALMNVGYAEASKRGAFDCFVFHDVDLVPEDDRSLYTCPADSPKHMAVAVNKWKYRLIYQNYFGGVTALSKEQFEKINGFANNFYGWGGEDDDLFHRVDEKGYKIFRYPANIARYSMLKHDYVSTNDNLEVMMEKSKHNKLGEDGLSTLHYEKLNEHMYPLYTWILAKLPPAPEGRKKTFWDQAKESLWSGMNGLAGDFAAGVAKQAHKFAEKQDDAEENKKNHVY